MISQMQKIVTIVNHVRDKIQKENKILCEQGRHSEQQSFDYDGAILALVCRDDSEIDQAYAMIIGK